MWSKKGDHIVLSTGCRGFQSTSMSICLYIQPQPLMEELAQMFVADGFIFKILNKTAEVEKIMKTLKNSTYKTFTRYFYHKNRILQGR